MLVGKTIEIPGAYDYERKLMKVNVQTLSSAYNNHSITIINNMFVLNENELTEIKKKEEKNG